MSVVVPVRDREGPLRDLLDALAQQTFRDFEVIVVDDGSRDGSAVEVAGAIADDRLGVPLRLLHNPGRGAVAARRAGVAASNAPYLAFTDSDCQPVPEWLREGVARLDEGADVVNGLTRPVREAAPLERSIGSGEEGLYPTCNVFYRRRAYDAAGGFDELAGSRFGFGPGSRERRLGFGEDTLLAWEVRRAGTAAYAPGAVVEHHVFGIDLAESFRRTWMMKAFPALVREVPELRHTTLMRGRVLLGSADRLPVYGVVAGLLLRRRGAAAAAAGWWLCNGVQRARRTPARWRRRVAAIPVEMTIDVVAGTALVVGSIRARAVVL
ncbi:MAG: glycosyltransferase family 2 protein [Acidimicrobiales bacterium]